MISNFYYCYNFFLAASAFSASSFFFLSYSSFSFLSFFFFLSFFGLPSLGWSGASWSFFLFFFFFSPASSVFFLSPFSFSPSGFGGSSGPAVVAGYSTSSYCTFYFCCWRPYLITLLILLATSGQLARSIKPLSSWSYRITWSILSVLNPGHPGPGCLKLYGAVGPLAI